MKNEVARRWLTGSLLGIAVGSVILGVGGRIAMWAIAVVSGGTPAFSVGGSATVVLLGALAGLAGAVVLVGLRWILANKPLVRGAVFWAFLVLVTLRGLRPIDPQRVLLFMPLVVVYGITLQVLSRRLESRRRTPESVPLQTVLNP
jgi:hypothetical protein